MSIDTEPQIQTTCELSTEEQLKTYPQLAQTLIDNGYTILPIKRESKIPAIRGWMHPYYRPPVTGFEGCSTAIKTGSGKYPVIAIDIDVTDEKLGKEIQNIVSEIAGPTIYRIGQYPKTIMLYRLVESSMRKMSSIKYDLGHLEILANGQYFIADGIHPDTKQKYTWYGGSPQTIPAKDLPLITVEQTQQIITLFQEKALSLGAEPEKRSCQSRPSGAAVPAVLNVLNIPNIPNKKVYQQKPIGLKPYWCINLLKRLDPNCKRKRWIKIGMALHHEFRGSQEAFKIWDDWSARSKLKYVPGETLQQWQSFNRGYTGTPVTGATLRYFAKGKGVISSKPPKNPKRPPLSDYCQKAIIVLQEQSAKSGPWSLRMLLYILQKHLKTGRTTAEKVIKNLVQNSSLTDNSDKDCLCQYVLTGKGKQSDLPERKEYEVL